MKLPGNASSIIRMNIFIKIVFFCYLSSQTFASAIVFKETFDTISGNLIAGQNDWVANFGGNNLSIQDNGILDQMSVGVRTPSFNSSTTNEVYKPLTSSLDSSQTNTYSFDAYATTGNGISYGSHTGFSSTTANVFIQAAWSNWDNAASIVGGSGTGWYFYIGPELTGRSGFVEFFDGGMNTEVGLSIVLDSPTNEVYGVYDFNDGNGPRETTHVAYNPDNISLIDSAFLHYDYRSYSSGHMVAMDNLTVTTTVPDQITVPEPSAYALILIGFLGIAAMKRKHCKS